MAQILAASAYPTQIVEAERFLQQNPSLKDAALGAEVDKQDWDPSVKALIQFPSVLADLDKNLSWTSELGDANYNQQPDVMAAVQFMRGKAEAAGNLKSTPQQSVTDQDDSVVIQPANPDTVYVPDYDPELAYGYPVGSGRGSIPGGTWTGRTFLSVLDLASTRSLDLAGVGTDGAWIGATEVCCMEAVRYVFQSHAFYDRNAYFHGNYRGNASSARGDRSLRGFGSQDGRGNQQGGRGNEGARPGAFGGISRGGDARGNASRGMSSMGGGMRGGGGGGMRGGGGGGRGSGGGHR